MIECVPTRDVVHQKSSGGPSVVRPCNRSECLLSCRVPNLKLDLLSFNVDHAGPEFYSYGEVVDRLEPFVGELKQEARFANTCVPDDDVLEQV